MPYQDLPLELRLQLDSLSVSEFQELCERHDGPIRQEILDHYRETHLWWADTITLLNGEVAEVDPPDRIPDVKRLEGARSRGTFLL